MTDVFTCELRVSYRGKELALDKLISRIELADILPLRGPIEPMMLGLYNERTERRNRFVDMLASNFAHALTEGLFDEAIK